MMQVNSSETLTQEDADHLFEWREHVFPIEGEDLEWSGVDWHLTASINDGRPIAHIGYDEFFVIVNEHSRQAVVGVADVVVRPECQGKHIPSRLFEYLHKSTHAKNISELFVLFFPLRLETYYQQQGYQKFVGDYTFTQGDQQCRSDDFILMYYGKDLSAVNSIKLMCEPW